MSLRFFRRVRLLPGVSLNFSKRGASVSLGPRGFKYTVGSSGVRHTVGLPGTGLYYTDYKAYHHGPRRSSAQPAPVARTPIAGERLDLGFFKRLFTPEPEKHFVDGLRLVTQGDDAKAIDTLDAPGAVPDALFMAGILALKLDRYADALGFLNRAEGVVGQLGKDFDNYGVHAAIQLPISEKVTAAIGPDRRGLILARAEAEQALHRWHDAIASLDALHEDDPKDPVVLLSLVEILTEEEADAAAWRRVVGLTKDVQNDSEVETATLYWKSRALRLLGLTDAASDTLAVALRRKAGRNPELLKAIRYERALVFDATGQAARARQEFGRIYAEDPTYEDVAKRLGTSDATAVNPSA